VANQGRPRKLIVLGATGTIGELTLEVAARHPDRLQVIGLAAGRNARRLAELAERFRPAAVALAGPGEPPPGWRGTFLNGPDAARDLARWPEGEIVGAAGLAPSLAALEAGRRLALANKESLVLGGGLLREACARGGAEIVPVDSEHSALHQCLTGQRRDAVRRVVLTASGGPFRTWSREALAGVTPREALQHPTWRMGPRITIDSATLLNKGFEVIEAQWLFDLPLERIDVWVHPQAIVHGLVEFDDGALIAQLSRPDMRLPIQYALSYPERWGGAVEPCSAATIAALGFEEPDEERFPCLALAREAARRGGLAPAVLNAADEVLVEAFLAGRIRFPGIAAGLAHVLARQAPAAASSLEEILAADRAARRAAQEFVDAGASR
jgi:1-deoxy-D-xylulose-5-phosphate reductoisomerase